MNSFTLNCGGCGCGCDKNCDGKCGCTDKTCKTCQKRDHKDQYGKNNKQY